MKLTDLIPNIGEVIPYEYGTIRCREYEQLLSSLLAEVKSSQNPHFVQVGGIPGAGKSTFCRTHCKTDELFISFDGIMESLPQYRTDIYTLGKAESFTKWEIPARVIGYELLRRAVEKKCNICLEHSGVNIPHVQLMNNIRKYGYHTEMSFILCNVEKAHTRAIQREAVTNRHTPYELIEKRASLVKKFLPEYIKITDKLSIYDTSSDKDVLLKNYTKGYRVS